MTSTSSPVDCSRCVNRGICGTVPSADLWGCFGYCIHDCERENCDFTCPNNEPLFSSRVLEVGGFALDKIDSLLPARVSAPTYLPNVFGHTSRNGPLMSAWAALPLGRLFRQVGVGGIEPIASTPTELRKKFKLRTDARIIASGVGPDARIEWLWHHFRTAPLARWLLEMGVEAATAPNYSYFSFLPRDQFLWNRKRMLLFCQELGRGGFPVIPHLYGETSFDAETWARLYYEHPLLDSFCIELQTGDASKARFQERLKQILEFRNAVRRPLTAVVVGGRYVATALAAEFPSLVIIESSAYIKTMRRRLAIVGADGKLRYQRFTTTGKLDALLDHNTRVIGEWIDSAAERARDRKEKIETPLPGAHNFSAAETQCSA